MQCGTPLAPSAAESSDRHCGVSESKPARVVQHFGLDYDCTHGLEVSKRKSVNGHVSKCEVMVLTKNDAT
jgi:hypothetical protein